MGRLLRSIVCAFLFVVPSAKAATITPATFDFGEVFVGTTASATVMLSVVPANSLGDWHLSLNTGSFIQPFTANDGSCGGFGVGADCPIQVTFTPPSVGEFSVAITHVSMWHLFFACTPTPDVGCFTFRNGQWLDYGGNFPMQPSRDPRVLFLSGTGVEVTPVPIPAPIFLLISALATLGWFGARRTS